jgi:hypothetical protein
MMRLSNGERADDPLGRVPGRLAPKARNAKDTWLPGTLAIETALEAARCYVEHQPTGKSYVIDTKGGGA